MRRGRLVVAVAAALVWAAPAGAHAFLTQSDPASGALLRTAPRAVRLVFDTGVRPAAGTDVLTAGHSVAAGTPFVPAGEPNVVVVPLRANLGSGPYAVTWSEISTDDGHRSAGAFIFTVGSGPLVPSGTTATGAGGASLAAVVSRGLLLAGLLAAAGSFAFALLVARGRRDGVVLAVALAVAALGAVLSVVLEQGAADTRFGHRMLIGAALCAVGAGTAPVPRLWLGAGGLAVVLLALPTATGHASASGVPQALSIPADLAHLAAAAVWVGGLLQLVLRRRADLARRFAPFALAAVALLGASGLVRAVNELRSVDQLWTTGYGRALLVKTGLLLAILALARIDRRRGELALVAVVVGAVAVLTNVRPGRDYAVAAPPSRTVVYAGQAGNLAVGLALTPRSATTASLRATVLGFDGPASGLDVRFGAVAAVPCGRGCYGATVSLAHDVSVRVSGRRLRVRLPSQLPAPDGTEIVRRAAAAIAGLRTLVVRSHLASDARHEVTTTYRMVAPDRLAYENDDGSGAVIVGGRRWDRTSPGARWVESAQVPPTRQPAPFWQPTVVDAHVLRTDRLGGRAVWVVSFVDPLTPAWFTAWIDRSSYRTLRLDMVATAHFMHDVDGPFDAAIHVDPPARR